MFQRRCARPNNFMMPMQESMVDIDNNTGTIDIDVNQMQSTSMGAQPNMMGMAQTSNPIMEPVQERVVQRTIMHEVPHVCPIRTRVVNNHVYRHTYRPEYSCCEENTCTNVQCGSCCNY